jgi:hypothetical protein
MRTGLVALLIVVLALIWFNPDMADFKTFIGAQSERLLQQETDDSEFGDFLSQAGGALAGAFVDRITDRNNYLLFSTYTIDFDGDEADENEWRFLGIAGFFLELQQPEALEGNGN